MNHQAEDGKPFEKKSAAALQKRRQALIVGFQVPNYPLRKLQSAMLDSYSGEKCDPVRNSIGIKAYETAHFLRSSAPGV